MTREYCYIFVEGHFLLLLEYSMKRLTLTGSCVTEVLRCCCLLIMLLIQLGEGMPGQGPDPPSDLPSKGKSMYDYYILYNY